MACKNQTLFFFPWLLALTVLLLGVAVAAGRDIPSNNEKTKQPQWLIGHDGSFLIPGIGRVLAPPKFQPHLPSYPPQYQYGSAGPVAGGAGGGGSHIPGGDDNPIPNPGVEVPSPAFGAANPSPP